MFTIPNIISFIRLLLIPVFVILLVQDRFAAAGWLLGLIGATDWVDGYLARKLNQVTEIGKFLDPLADRLAVGVAVIGGLLTGILDPWFAIAIIVREALIGIGALVIGVSAGTKLEVRKVGKLATLLLYMAIAWFYVGLGTPYEPLVVAAWLAGIPGLLLYYLSAFLYLGDARSIMTASDR